MKPEGTDNLAVLIDADNAQASVISDLLAEVARYGTATVKRAYGDWTTPNLSGWKDVLHVHGDLGRVGPRRAEKGAALEVEALDRILGEVDEAAGRVAGDEVLETVGAAEHLEALVEGLQGDGADDAVDAGGGTAADKDREAL